MTVSPSIARAGPRTVFTGGADRAGGVDRAGGADGGAAGEVNRSNQFPAEALEA